MDSKWMAIMIIGITVGMFSPLSIMEYSKYQCRIEAVRVQMPADDILKVCK